MSDFRSTIWPEVSEPALPTSAILCIRSLVKPTSGQHRQYASMSNYTVPLKERFGPSISVHFETDANWLHEAINRQLTTTAQGVLLAVEATEHIPAMITCMRVFDEVRHALAHASDEDVRRVTPVLIRDPLLSHSIGSGRINGPAELHMNATQRHIRIVDTMTTETAERFKEFLEITWPMK